MGRLLSYFVELVFFVVVARMLGRAFQGLFGPVPPRGRARAQGGDPRDSSGTRIGKTERDPVCGMFVSTELSHRLVSGSKTLHFCSHECLERYQKEMANVSA